MNQAQKAGIVPAAEPQKKTNLQETITKYLEEVQGTRKRRTYNAYKLALRNFVDSLPNPDRTLESIGRDDMIRFKVWCRDNAGLDERTVSNRWTDVMTFWNSQGYHIELKKGDTPTYTEEEPEIYTPDEIERFFAACTDEEHLIFSFFQQTACREQEVIFCTDKSLDFYNCSVTLRANPEHGWTPKAHRGRTIPVSRQLVERLKKHLVKRGKGGLLFPTETGKPKFDFLDMCKRIAKRAGMDNANFWLHKWRATTITMWLRRNPDFRTVMR